MLDQIRPHGLMLNVSSPRESPQPCLDTLGRPIPLFRHSTQKTGHLRCWHFTCCLPNPLRSAINRYKFCDRGLSRLFGWLARHDRYDAPHAIHHYHPIFHAPSYIIKRGPCSRAALAAFKTNTVGHNAVGHGNTPACSNKDGTPATPTSAQPRHSRFRLARLRSVLREIHALAPFEAARSG